MNNCANIGDTVNAMRIYAGLLALKVKIH